LHKLNFSSGQGLVEYALILILVALVIIVILSIFGTELGETYSNIISSI
jgi:pilus assembly protein Flp/PilA